MNSAEKRLRQNLRALKDSGRSFRDMYEILFCGEMQDLVMCETALPLRTREMTYGDAERAIGRLAAALYGAIGACDRYVGLWGANSAEWLVAFWAILRSGNRPYPMDPQSSDTETAKAFQSLDIRAVLCVTKDAPQAFGDGVEVLDASVLLSRGASLPELPCELPFGEYVALGKEKLCVWRGADLAYRILDAERAVKENPMLIGDPKTGVKHLAILPFSHIFGLGAVYLQFAFFGATFVFPAGDAPDVLLYTARRCEITHLFAAPQFWHTVEKAALRAFSSREGNESRAFEKRIASSLSLQKRFPRFGTARVRKGMREIRMKLLPDSVRFCVSVGGSLKPSALRLLNALGYPLANAYGTAECGLVSVELSHRVGVRVSGSLGKPVPSLECRIGEDGTLLVQGDSLADCLMPSGTIAETGGCVDTGDLMRMDADGRCYFLARAADVITLGNGGTLSPDELTFVFSLRGALNHTVLSGGAGEAPMLVVEIPKSLSYEAWDLLEREIDARNAALPDVMQVKKVWYTHDPLLSPTDFSIRRDRLLREIDAGRVRLFDRASAMEADEAERTDVRARIRALLSEILGIPEEEIAGDAHFMMDLGGSSLDYYALIGELDRTFDVKLPYESENFAYSLDDFERIIKELLKAHV